MRSAEPRRERLRTDCPRTKPHACLPQVQRLSGKRAKWERPKWERPKWGSGLNRIACLRRYKDYVHASHVEEDMSFWQVSGLRGLRNSPGDGRPSSSYATGPVLASSALVAVSACAGGE